MELSSLLSGPASFDTQIHQHEASASPDTTHTFPTRNTTMAGMNLRTGTDRMGTPELYSGNPSNMNTPHSTTMSPFGHANPIPKSVAFELMFPESPQYRARLPMRVQIFPHDTTDSIVTTVKNFYGLYAGPAGAKGVSFEDVHGNTLIARYENFTNNMVVYVRVIGELSAHPAEFGPLPYASAAHVMAQPYHSGDAHHMGPPAQALNYGQPNSRPMSRMSRKRSISPGGRGRRSASASTNPLPAPKKSRSQSGFKSRGSSTHGGSFADIHSDGMTGYSSGDGAPGSVSSKTKSEHLGNTEISLDNIVEGGRRKRAKFESSVRLPFTPDYNSTCLTTILSRNFPCLLPRKCPQLPRAPPSRRLVAWSISVLHSPIQTDRTTHSRIHTLFSRHKAMEMGSGNLACTLHPARSDAPVKCTRAEFQWAHPALTLLYCLPLIQLSAAACQRKIRTWLCS